MLSRQFELINLRLNSELIKSRLGATTLPDDEQTLINNWYAFFAGFSADTKFKNTTNCFNRMTNLTWTDVPQFYTDLAAANNIFEEADAATLLT
jgi:hypothetical protein